VEDVSRVPLFENTTAKKHFSTQQAKRECIHLYTVECKTKKLYITQFRDHTGNNIIQQAIHKLLTNGSNRHAPDMGYTYYSKNAAGKFPYDASI
jgi:hypothetical protein